MVRARRAQRRSWRKYRRAGRSNETFRPGRARALCPGAAFALIHRTSNSHCEHPVLRHRLLRVAAGVPRSADPATITSCAHLSPAARALWCRAGARAGHAAQGHPGRSRVGSAGPAGGPRRAPQATVGVRTHAEKSDAHFRKNGKQPASSRSCSASGTPISTRR